MKSNVKLDELDDAMAMMVFRKEYNELSLSEKQELIEIVRLTNNPEWKQISIDGQPTTYRINNLGDIYNEKTKRYLHGSYSSSGSYPVVNLCIRGKMYSRLIHVLVASLFVDKPQLTDPNLKLEVNHKDGNKNNYRWWNLEWVTRSANMKHAYANNLLNIKTCEESPKSLYTNAQIHEVCRLLEMGLHARAIYRKTGIPEYVSYHIKTGKCWKDIAKQYKIPKPREIPYGPRGKSKKSKLYPPEKIHEICRLLEENKLPQSEIARQTGVSPYLVYDIKRGTSWPLYSKQYKIPKPNSSRRPGHICEKLTVLIENTNMTTTELLKAVGLPDTPQNQSYVRSTRSRILKRRSSTTIDQLR